MKKNMHERTWKFMKIKKKSLKQHFSNGVNKRSNYIIKKYGKK